MTRTKQSVEQMLFIKLSIRQGTNMTARVRKQSNLTTLDKLINLLDLTFPVDTLAQK